jgi:hypothetical protein
MAYGVTTGPRAGAAPAASPTASPAPSVLHARTALSRRGELVVLVSGVLAAAANCAFLFRAASASRLDPVNSMISELEVPGQPLSWFFRGASLLSGLAAVVFALGLRPRIPAGRSGQAGCLALAFFGLAGAADAVFPMDCAPSASAVCLRADEDSPTNWLYQAHTWFDVAGSIAVLVSLWFLGRHLVRHPEWRHATAVTRAGFAGLAAVSVVLTVMSARYLPGVGVVQRIEVLGVSGWLLVLALAVRRRRPG